MTEQITFGLNETDAPILNKALSLLSRIGYNETDICKRLNILDMNDLTWRSIPIYRMEQMSARDTLDIAIDLFLLQGIIPKDELDDLFQDAEQEALCRAGVLTIDEEICWAGASLYPVGDCLIFSDHAWPSLPNPGMDKTPSDQVMYVGMDSRWLARIADSNPIGSALDLCTGSGIHALLASYHAKRVVAVDINPRAVDCTKFNSQALGKTNMEVAAGDLYEPVGDEKFDLITANPPFVPAPVNEILFRDGGNSGEDVQRRIIEGLPKHLAQGGTAQIVTELGEGEMGSITDRLRSWLGGAPMNILILRLYTRSAGNYAVSHAVADDNEYGTFLFSVGEWADNLKSQGYSQVVSVLLVFSWSDPRCGEPWTRIEEMLPPQKNAVGEVEAIFASENIVRHEDFNKHLATGKLSHAGVIGFIDIEVIGGDVYDATCKMPGKALTIAKTISSVERKILMLMKEPLTFSELLVQTIAFGFSGEVVRTAVRALIQHGFVKLTV